MTNALARKIERFREAADEAREALASTVFDLNTVLETMARATSQGYRAVKIQPPLPIDLSGTKAAKELASELGKAGATVEWMPRGQADGATERYCELIVKW